MALGMLWYGPVFGKQWMKLSRITPQRMKSMPLTPAKAMGIGCIATLVMAFVLGHFVDIMGAKTWGQGAQTGFWVWLGFMAPLTLGVFLWEGKPFRLFVLNAAYYLVQVLIMGAILAVW